MQLTKNTNIEKLHALISDTAPTTNVTGVPYGVVVPKQNEGITRKGDVSSKFSESDKFQAGVGLKTESSLQSFGP